MLGKTYKQVIARGRGMAAPVYLLARMTLKHAPKTRFGWYLGRDFSTVTTARGATLQEAIENGEQGPAGIELEEWLPGNFGKI